jgi:hypothetical protein
MEADDLWAAMVPYEVIRRRPHHQKTGDKVTIKMFS